MKNRFINFFHLLLFILIINENSFPQSFSYTESFESSNPFVFWTSNATYTINSFSPSIDRAFDGNQSLKMDITINGSGTKDCYYYWKLPVKTNLHGTINFSARLWMDADAATYVKLGYYYDFPPTGLERLPTAPTVTQFNTWFTQSTVLSNDVAYHADYFANTKIYNSTKDDFGRELQFVALTIKAKGSHRIIFYIDKVEITGTNLSQTDFVNQYTTAWNKYKSEVDAIVIGKHSEFNNLQPVPDTSGRIVTPQGLIYFNNLKSAKINMTNLLTTMDNSEYFAPSIMDSMNTLLGLYPSWVNLLINEISNPGSKLDIFSFPATAFNRLDETNQPGGLTSFEKLNVRACSGEYEPLSILLQAKSNINNINVRWTDFSGSSGTIPSTALDVSIAKVWYQAGLDEYRTTSKIPMQELLVKNDSLIKMDLINKLNYLLVTNSNGSKSYIDITTSSATFPTGITISDSPTLLPFKIMNGRNKQLWLSFHIPTGTPAGIYIAQFTVLENQNIVRTFPVEIEVLPFNLDPSRLTYGVYYHGYLDNFTDRPFYYSNKKEAQLRLELADIKEHGILYPTCYQSLNNLAGDLQIRNAIGLPNDRLYTVTFSAGNPQTQPELDALKSQVAQWKTKMSSNGYSNLYVYGIDEATGSTLTSQRPAWQAVHDAGASIFVASYVGTADIMGDLLDVGNILGGLNSTEATKYHSFGHKIFSYSNPQVGYENPDVYRRNYGIALLQAGYDGAMNYAYQKNYGSFWNDWDGATYREQCFTYPVSNGIISTIQWEGFREGIDDVRYLSTLLNKIDQLKASGINTASLDQFINAINTYGDLDLLRSQIISKIIESQNIIPEPDRTLPQIVEATIVNPTCLKVDFDEALDATTAQNKSNFTIASGITVNSVVLNADNKSVTIATSTHHPYSLYTITANNILDVTGNLINPNFNKHSYSFGSFVKVKAKIFLQGAYSNNSMNTNLLVSGVIPLQQPYNLPPWNYPGKETVSKIPSGTVDWLLFELRTGTGVNSIVSRRAAFLKSDGRIFDIDDSEGVKFDSLIHGNYYLVVRHRNHLGIMSASFIFLSDTSSQYDFTSAASKTYGDDPIAFLGSGIYGMYAGDGAANGTVNVLDYCSVANSIFQTGYKQGDMDLNQVINVLDYGKTYKSLFKTSKVPSD
ncbi:MAG: hypothetical protein NTX22_05325 [Ignavibacteriales bacterium]|nr:hypothetical protein [Ignavibacteriales bacterium]